MTSRTWRRAGTGLHVAAACALCYVVGAQFVVLTGLLLHLGGMARADAAMLANMLGFLYLCALLLWAFSRERAVRTWLFLGLAGVAALLATVLAGGAPVPGWAP